MHARDAVRRGVNKINEMIENTRERNRLLSERATKQSMKPLNVMSIISAVKGEDKDNSIRPPTSLHSMNSNGTHISLPNGKSMSASPTTLADAFVPEAVRFGSDAFINKVRTSIRENKMFSVVSSSGREAYRFVKKHGDVGADKIFEGLKELADENVETDAVIAAGSGVGDDNEDDSEMKLEIERKIVPLAMCSAIMKAAIEDVHSSEGGSSDILAVAVKAKGFVVENSPGDILSTCDLEFFSTIFIFVVCSPACDVDFFLNLFTFVVCSISSNGEVEVLDPLIVFLSLLLIS